MHVNRIDSLVFVIMAELQCTILGFCVTSFVHVAVVSQLPLVNLPTYFAHSSTAKEDPTD